MPEPSAIFVFNINYSSSGLWDQQISPPFHASGGSQQALPSPTSTCPTWPVRHALLSFEATLASLRRLLIVKRRSKWLCTGEAAPRQNRAEKRHRAEGERAGGAGGGGGEREDERRKEKSGNRRKEKRGEDGERKKRGGGGGGGREGRERGERREQRTQRTH
jgi:hypothetical protein